LFSNDIADKKTKLCDLTTQALQLRYNNYNNEEEKQNALKSSFLMLLECSNNGFTPAHELVAQCYFAGTGTRIDRLKAIEFLKKNDKNDKITSLRNLTILALRLRHINYNNKEEKQNALKSSFLMLLECSNNGYKPAHELVAECYFDGNGTRKDWLKAIEFMKKYDPNYFLVKYYEDCLQQKNAEKNALKNSFTMLLEISNNGYNPAHKLVAKCYFYGVGTHKDRLKALEFMKKYDNYHCYEKYFKDCCSDLQQILFLAIKYTYGEINYDGNGNDIIADKKKAFELFLYAAKNGYSPAFENVAECYLEGVGVSKNYEKALKWIKRDGTTFKIERYIKLITPFN
jgi:TPR repeat protein